MEFRWGVRNLRRHPFRTALSIAGIAIASAMLLDMVLPGKMLLFNVPAAPETHTN